MKNKKILIAVLGVAVLFYQLHGMNYFDFGWPTTESLKKKSYDLFKSPLFWTVAGSGMIAVAVWNLYKKRSAPGGGASQLSRSPAIEQREEQPPSVRPSPAPGSSAGSESSERKIELGAEVRAVLPKEVAGRIHVLVSKMSDEGARDLGEEINQFFTKTPIDQSNYKKSLIDFLNTPKSFFRIFFLLSEIPEDENYQEVRAKLMEIYAILHLLARMSQEDQELVKKKLEAGFPGHPNIENIADYMITALDRKQLYDVLQTFIKPMEEAPTPSDTKISPYGELLIKALDRFLWYKYDPAWRSGKPESEYPTDKVANRLRRARALRSLKKAFHDHDLSVPKELHNMFERILSDAWISVSEVNSLLKTYKEALAIFDKQGGRDAKGKDEIFKQIVQKLEKEKQQGKEKRRQERQASGMLGVGGEEEEEI